MRGGKLVLWLLVVLWMAVIFLFSAQPAGESLKTSALITEAIIKIAPNREAAGGNALEESAPESAQEKENKRLSLDRTVRKHAHFALYFVLGILLAAALWKRDKKFARSLYALGISLLYAATDEIHQIYVPGRSFSPPDIAMDLCGAAAGVAVFFAFKTVY